MLVLVVVNALCALVKRFCNAPNCARRPLIVLIAPSTMYTAALAPVGTPLTTEDTSMVLTAFNALAPEAAVPRKEPVVSEEVTAKELEEWKSTSPPTTPELALAGFPATAFAPCTTEAKPKPKAFANVPPNDPMVEVAPVEVLVITSPVAVAETVAPAMLI